MGRQVVFDIETSGLLDDKSLIYHQGGEGISIRDDYKMWCAVIKDIDTGQVFRLRPDDMHKLPKMLEKCSKIIGHNIINFDLLALKLVYGMEFDVYNQTVGGKPVEIVDTLVMSKMLYPDRLGHGLKAWGERLSFFKGAYGQQDEAWDKFSEEMLEYCEQDVHLNHKVYDELIKEWGDWDWSDAFHLEQCIKELATYQEHTGFKFDSELARWCVEDLNTKMAYIEAKVEPLLPLKRATKKFLSDATPPKRQVKKDLTPSSFLTKWLDKHKGELTSNTECRVFGKGYSIPLPDRPLVTKEPMTLADQTALKEYLITLGWNPTIWGNRDITIDSKKRRYSKENYIKAVQRYIEETKVSEFKRFRLEENGFKSVSEMQRKLLEHDTSRGLKLSTGPKFTDQKKDLCPNLVKLGDKVEFVKDVVEWLTYRHRRNAILSPDSDTKKEESGWLTHSRLEVDGRIPTPVDTLGAATSRMTHKNIANIPRPSSLYGQHMRNLFGVDSNHYQVGFDFDSLEAKIEAHYCQRYDKDGAYCNAVLGEKPNDIHSLTANNLTITRDDAKSINYALRYGCQVKKLSRMLGVTSRRAEEIYKGFWETAYPLADLKKDVEKYWENTGGKKFIKGLDGRKLWARSKHSLINLLFQSAGVICAKRAAVWWWQQVKKNNFNYQSLIMYHDEQQTQCPKNEVKIKLFSSEENVILFKRDWEKKNNKTLSDVGHKGGKWYVAYAKCGELLVKSAEYATDYYKLRTPLTGGYQVGKTWGDCH